MTAEEPSCAPALPSPGRHNVGPESTWAVRQSAELEDLQAALEKHCLGRKRQAPDAPVAPSFEVGSVSEDYFEPKYAVRIGNVGCCIMLLFAWHGEYCPSDLHCYLSC